MNKKITTIVAVCIFALAGIIYLVKNSQVESSIPDWQKGSTSPKVTLIEYADFQCPACSSYEPVIKRLTEEFADELQFTFRHFPLMQIHKNAFDASVAAEASGAQGKFWEMHDKLYATQTEWSSISDPTDKFVEYAKVMGLNEDKFKADLKNSELEAHVLANMKLGEKENVRGTPTFFLNGSLIQNPGSYEAIAQLVKTALGQTNTQTLTDLSSAPEVHEHADFIVFLDNTQYDFSQAKYQSSESKERDKYIHLHDGNGKEIHIHRANLTLAYFFKTLGITFNKSCFKLDNGTNYCNSADKTLKLFVNGQPNDEFGNYTLKDLDRIVISYGPKEDANVNEQLKKVSDEACIYSKTCPERGKPPTENCVGGLGTTCE